MRSKGLFVAWVVLALIATVVGCELAAGVGHPVLGDPGTGGNISCGTAVDCPTPKTLCQTPACNSSRCGTSNVAMGTACTDANGKLCDGNGTCVACLADSDCTPTGTSCASVACTLGACVITDAMKGTACSEGTGVICDGSGSCVVMHCGDGIQDGDETDADCGGMTCSVRCAQGQKCLVDADCASMGCDVKTHTCDADQCHDGIQNGNETDVDCGGGACPACIGGQKCSMSSDCVQYFICTSNACVREPESDCLDGVDNNGDGLADCQDPTCTSAVSCVPVGPGGSQVGVLNGSCPSGFGPGVQENTGFHEGTCGGCSCSINATCQLHVNWRQSPSSGCSGTPQDIYLNGSAGGTSSCVGLSGVSDQQIYAFGVTTQSESCAVGGAPSYTSNPYWDVSTSFCPATRTSATCASGQVCAPIPAPAKMCVEIPGNVACPAGYATPTQYYANFSPGGCSACPVSCTAGTNGCGATVATYGYSDGCCGCLAHTTVGPFYTNQCSSFTATGVASANAVFSKNANDCSVGQPSANASTPNGVTTICCM